MINDYIYDDGGRHRYFRMKYKKDHGSDCVMRALAIATKTDYQDTRKELWEISLSNGRLPNNSQTYEEFLDRRDAEKIIVPKGDKIELRYYPFDERSVYLAIVRVGFGTHLVAVDQKLIRDTWDCRNHKVLQIFKL